MSVGRGPPPQLAKKLSRVRRFWRMSGYGQAPVAQAV
jgi:hypothetical protein